MSGSIEEKPSLRGIRWQALEPDPSAVEGFSDLDPIVARVLAIRGISASSAPTFLDPSLVALPAPDAGDWVGVERVAVADWSAGGIVVAQMVCAALVASGTRCRLDPLGRPAPGLREGLAIVRGLLEDHPGRGAQLRSLLKFAAVAAIREDLCDPLMRTCVALGLAELDKGKHSPGLASAMHAAMVFSGGLRTADMRTLADRIELGGALSVRLLQETRPPEARELGAELAKVRDGRRPRWEAAPRGEYELSGPTLDWDLVRALEQLEPTGVGFPEPLIRVVGVPTRARAIKKLHLKAALGDVDLIWRGGASFLEHFAGGELALFGHLGISTWAGIQRLQFRVVDAVRGGG